MKSKLTKLLCMLLCLSILLGIVYVPVLAADGAPTLLSSTGSSSDGRTSVTSTETFIEDGIDYVIERTTQYIGTRTYGVEIKISAAVETHAEPESISASKEGYYTVSKSGYYLLELWGGDGGNGTENRYTFTGDTKVFPGGTGGDGGYVYAKVWLEKGQTLVYTIGTDGGQAAAGDESAGGENGEGGVHGEVGSRMVGAGGGFSALYFFDKGEFNADEWITDTSIVIPESARLSKYILIAGGGGGGGAGAGLSYFSTDLYAPNGGKGGTISSTSYITINGGTHGVSGYVFSGKNGSSSYNSTKYVGRGGTAVPADIVSTELNLAIPQVAPNDWTGTNNTTLPYGAGGSGNLRGGGGGAGFAGGSGGNMYGILDPSNVGGGGGGSSFIADHISYVGDNGEIVTKQLNFKISDDDIANDYLTRFNYAKVGGACEITYLGTDSELVDMDVFDNVSLTAEISKYFTINKNASSCGGTLSYSTNASTGGTTVKATNLDITPSSEEVTQSVAHVKLVLLANSDFVGGNSVEMVHSIVAELDNPHGYTNDIVLKAKNDASHDFVNVPLNFVLDTSSYTVTMSNTPKVYNKSDFYTDAYASVRAAVNSGTADWRYDYIENIGDYTLWLGDSEQGSTVTIESTTVFTVKYVVQLRTPQTDEPVTVGPINDEPYVMAKNAVVSIVGDDTARINDVTVTAAKNLEYKNQSYLFKLILTQTTDEVVFPYSTQKNTSTGGGSYVVPASGWYFIQAWGGNGQNSEGVAIKSKPLAGSGSIKDDTKVKGAKGGAGGYVSGYIYMEAGSSIDFNVGSATEYLDTENYLIKQHNAATSDVVYKTSPGGAGGNYTTVSINGDVIIIAGGGGGAGGSAVTDTTGSNDPFTGSGKSGGNNSSISSTLILNDDNVINYTSYTGKSGTSGSAYGTYPFNDWLGRPTGDDYATGGDGGSGGANYRYSVLETGYDYAQSGASLSNEVITAASSLTTSKTSGTAGQVSITLIDSPKSAEERDKISSSDIELAFSQYFDVKSVTVSATSPSFSYTTTPVDMGNGNTATILSVTESNTPTRVLTKNAEGVEVLRYRSSVTLNVTLIPKDGFLGGNDVPVLISGYLGESQTDLQGKVESGVRITKGVEFMHPPQEKITDYANVDINFDFNSGGVENPLFSFHDQTITLGESIKESDLYTFDKPQYTGADAWKADFVEFVEPVSDGDDVITPDKTTLYPISVRLRAKNEAQNATIVGPVSDVIYELTATVYVNATVTYSLANMTADGDALIPHGRLYSFTIKPDTGYVLPESISVYHRISDTQRVEVRSFSYDRTTGLVTLPADIVTNHLEIVAASVKQTYGIHVVYATTVDPDEAPRIFEPQLKYEAGAPIDIDAIIAEAGISVGNITGYTYAWTYDTDDGTKPTTMPANELWVYGGYQKNTYTFTINYVFTDSSVAAPSTTVSVQYCDSYSIASPIIKGYKADLPVVSGVQGTSTDTITVTYTAAPGEVIILLIKQDGTNAFDHHIEETLLTGQEKTFNIAEDYSLTGYTPSVDSVTVYMDGDSQTIIVYYIPNKHTVEFVYEGGYNEYPAGKFADAEFDSDKSKLVEYDNVYSYNADTNATILYSGLPIPRIAGFSFEGWYLDSEFTPEQRVEDITKVTTDADHKLYAKWEAQQFQITIEYNFIYDDGDYLPDNYDSADVIRNELNNTQTVFSFAYGEEYNVGLNEYVGYSSYTLHNFVGEEKITSLKGTMPATSIYIIVTYEINSYTITFKDLPGSFIDYSDWNGVGEKPASVAADAYDTSWQTVVVKHDVSPKFPATTTQDDGTVIDNTPYHNTISTYSYEFKGWMSEDGQTYYNGLSPDNFPTAWGDVVYYTCFDATENIICLTAGSVTTYYTNVAMALEDMQKAFLNEESSPTSVTLKFRRNAHNTSEIDITDDTLVFDRINTNATARQVTIDLGGYSIRSTNGKALIQDLNHEEAISLIITDTATTKGGLYVHGDGDVVAIDFDSRDLSFTSDVKVSAISENGNATAIRFAATGSSTVMTFTAQPSLIAKAESGEAMGIHITGGTDTNTCDVYSTSTYTAYAPVIDVTGMNAYGVLSDNFGQLGSSSYYFITDMTVTGTVSAYGIYNVPTLRLCWLSVISVSATGKGATAVGVAGASSASFVSSSTPSYVSMSVEAPYGTAYGMIISSSMNSVNAEITVVGMRAIGLEVQDGATLTTSTNYNIIKVTGEKSAIGINVLEGGALTRSSSYYYQITVTATAGDAIGISNAGKINSVTATADVTATGGNAYGIYNVGGSVTGSGITTAMKVSATSNDALGYGIYSNGGNVGTTSSMLSAGNFAGSSYGIYCKDGSIYVSGNNLYFKGANKNTAIYKNTAPGSNVANGVIIAEGYTQTEANDGDPWSGAVGYYRLGRTWTITFVTNGGTEIESVVEIYDTPLKSVTTTKRGYTFVQWYSDENLTTAYPYPSFMPDSDVTLYAKWDIIEYAYTLDTDKHYLEVTFQTNYTANTGKTNESVTLSLNDTVLNKDSAILAENNAAWIFDDLTYKYSTNLYIFTGWYSTQTRTNASYVSLNGDISRYDTDNDGYITLYAGWQLLTGCGIYAPFGTTESRISFGAEYTSSSNCCYFYYVVPANGDYTVSYDNYHESSTANTTRKYYRVSKYTNQATTGTTATSTSNSSVYANTTLAHNSSYSYTNAQAGEVIVVRWYSRGNGSTYTTTTVAAMVSKTTADISFVGNNAISSSTVYKTQFIYTVESGENKDGIVELPWPTHATDESMLYRGWSHLVTTSDNGDMILRLTPDLVEKYDAWIRREVLDLYSQWSATTWAAIGSEGRVYPTVSFDNPGAPEASIAIPNNSTVSLAFATEDRISCSATFMFTNGLSAGTILTLVDRSEGFPVYYTYTVTDQDGTLTEIEASRFTRMGTDERFDGNTNDIVLQICYTNAEVTANSERVGIITTHLTPEAMLEYALIAPVAVEVQISDEASVDYLTEHSTPLTESEYDISDIDENETVYLLVRWDGIYVAPGCTFTLVITNGDGEETEVEATVYSGKYAKIETGLTVTEFMAEGMSYTIKYTLSTMQFNEFESHKFIYEFYTAPVEYSGTKTLFSDDVTLLGRFIESITLTETPSIKIPDTSSYYVSAGEVLTVENVVLEDEVINLSMEIYQLGDSGLEATDACQDLFTEAPMGTIETLVLDDGSIVLTVSDTAPAGRYYLKLIYGDKYVYLPVKVMTTS